MDLLRRVASDQQGAILVVTHDEKIFNRFDRIFHLRDGRLEAIEESKANANQTVDPRKPDVASRQAP